MGILSPRIRYIKIEISSKNDGFMHQFGVQCLVIKHVQLNYFKTTICTFQMESH